MSDFPEKLSRKLIRRQEENSFRELKPQQDLIDFSSNDYLGLSRTSLLQSATNEILKSNSSFNGATGSRLLTGNHNLYSELESYLKSFYDFESALIFNSGYDANIGFFSCVPQRNDIIFYDELIHASIRDGIKMSDAKAFKFKHNNVDDLRGQIDKIREKDFYEEIYVVTESVFSMDGDSPNISELAKFCNEHSLYFIVDEAHAIGVFGKGLVVEKNLQEKVFAQIITFGKAIGSHGAAILGSKPLKEYLINFARSLIYTTALAPHSIASILAAHQFLEVEYGKSLIEKLRQNIHYFNQTIEALHLRQVFLLSTSAIQIALISGNIAVRSLSITLMESGFDIRPILAPTVPKGNERLRICLHAFNTKDEIERVLLLIKENG